MNAGINAGTIRAWLDALVSEAPEAYAEGLSHARRRVRVAKAISLSFREEGSDHDPPSVWDEFLRAADEAIAAMPERYVMEPDILKLGIECAAELAYTTMVRRAQPGEWQEAWNWSVQSEKLREDWRAVIEAILMPRTFKGESLLAPLREIAKVKARD